MRFNMDLIRRLQTDVAPQIFTPRAVYDGRKNLFAAVELPFEGGSKEVSLHPVMYVVDLMIEHIFYSFLSH